MADLNPAFKAPPKLSDSFLAATQSGAEQRIAGVAAKHNYTVIADMSHASASAYRVLSGETGMAALRSAGVKHIAVEMLDPGQNIILEAYKRGEISDRTMRHNYIDLSVSSTQGDLGVDARATKTAIANMIQAGKHHDISIHGVNAYEGVYDPQKIGPVLDDLSRTRLQVLKDIDASPDYYGMNKKDQKNFISHSLEHQGLNKIQIDMHLDNMGFTDKLAKQGIAKTMSKADWIERLNRDDIVAERIVKQTNGERSLVIYGGAHVLRSRGDLDNLLPNSASIEVFDDKKSYEKNFLPKAEKQINAIGFDMKDRGDYSLDFKTGTWRDTAGGQSVVLGNGDPSPPLPKPSTPQVPLDIKF